MKYIFEVILCFFLGIFIYSLMKKFCGCNLVEGQECGHDARDRYRPRVSLDLDVDDFDGVTTKLCSSIIAPAPCDHKFQKRQKQNGEIESIICKRSERTADDEGTWCMEGDPCPDPVLTLPTFDQNLVNPISADPPYCEGTIYEKKNDCSSITDTECTAGAYVKYDGTFKQCTIYVDDEGDIKCGDFGSCKPPEPTQH